MISLSTRFDPQKMSVWSSQTGLGFFSDPQEAYRLAKPFLLNQMRELLENDWEEGNKTSEQDVLFHICKPAGTIDCPTSLEIILPETFDSFLDPSKGDMWRAVFENPRLFKVGYQKQERADLHPDLYLGFSRRRPMLSDNIFHIIQVLAPGLLALQYQFPSGKPRIKLSWVFPRRMWMVHNHAMLAEVMGSVEPLISAADNQKITFLEERQSHQGGANLSPVLKDRRHNLPFPVTLIQLENMRSLQAPDPATQDGKEPSPEEVAAQASTGHPIHISVGKGKKRAAPEKKKALQRKKPRRSEGAKEPHRILEGYLRPKSSCGYGGYDWSVCDKDCGWCGRCQMV